MGQLHSHIDPASTRMVLNTLSLAIDETRLMREIETLEKRIGIIQSQSHQFSLTQQLIQEKATLIQDLQQVRDKANALY